MRTIMVVAAAMGLLAVLSCLHRPRPKEGEELERTRQPGGIETRITDGGYNAWLMPFGPFSPDGRRLVYDTRAEDGAMGANGRIETVEIGTGEVKVIYRTPGQTINGPGCGTPSFGPDGRVVFIHGLMNGEPYGVTRRFGMLVSAAGEPLGPLDSRDLISPFTPGALRGGTHAHEWSGDGRMIGFTYNDEVMARLGRKTGRDLDLRMVGVAVDDGPVVVDRDGAGANHDGRWFCAVVSRVTPDPRPGSDDIRRAFENAWVGRHGYRRADGTMQRAQAFLGEAKTADGRSIIELYLVDIPERLDRPGPGGPLAGTEDDFPKPPLGCEQRRLTRTESRKFPGVLTEPRHWAVSSADGEFVSVIMRDDDGVAQIWLARPRDGFMTQLTRNPWPVESTLAWSPRENAVAYVADGGLFAARVGPAGELIENRRLTGKSGRPPIYPAWSPDGKALAYVREDGAYRQAYILALED